MAESEKCDSTDTTSIKKLQSTENKTLEPVIVDPVNDPEGKDKNHN